MKLKVKSRQVQFMKKYAHFENHLKAIYSPNFSSDQFEPSGILNDLRTQSCRYHIQEFVHLNEFYGFFFLQILFNEQKIVE